MAQSNVATTQFDIGLADNVATAFSANYTPNGGLEITKTGTTSATLDGLVPGEKVLVTVEATLDGVTGNVDLAAEFCSSE